MEKIGKHTDEATKPETRRVDKPPEQRFEQFLERVLRDAEANRFPIPYRLRDCERFNQFPERLNARNEEANPQGIRHEIDTILRVLMNS